MYEILIRNVISLNHIAKVRRNPTDSKEFATFFSDLLRHSILFATNLYCTPISCRNKPIFCALPREQLFPYWETKIPSLGTSCSLTGNVNELTVNDYSASR